MLYLNLFAAGVIFCIGLCSVNNMGRETRHGIRYAWVGLTTAAFSILISPLFGEVNPSRSEVFFTVCVALFVLANRRRNCPYCQRRRSTQ